MFVCLRNGKDGLTQSYLLLEREFHLNFIDCFHFNNNFTDLQRDNSNEIYTIMVCNPCNVLYII